MKYRRRQTFDAVQWKGDNLEEVGSIASDFSVTQEGALFVEGTAGMFVARVGDFLVREAGGIPYTMSKENFDELYEVVASEVNEHAYNYKGSVDLWASKVWHPVMEGEAPEEITHSFYFRRTGITVTLTSTNRQPDDHLPYTEWAQALGIHYSQLRKDDQVLGIRDWGRTILVRKR